jgi:hypothetical protein
MPEYVELGASRTWYDERGDGGPDRLSIVAAKKRMEAPVRRSAG